MIISKDFVYARPPKTGSQSVTQMLSNFGVANLLPQSNVSHCGVMYTDRLAVWHHLTPADVDRDMPDHLVVSVRHPVDIYISAFQFQCAILRVPANDRYLLECVTSRTYPSVLLGKTLSDYFTRSFKKVTLLRAESLHADVEKLLGATVPEIHINKSRRMFVSDLTYMFLAQHLKQEIGFYNAKIRECS